MKSNKNHLLLIGISYLAFISLGLPDGLLGISWPFMSEKLEIRIDSLGILLIIFVAGYLSTSTVSGKILAIMPLGFLLAASCAVTGISLLAFAYSNYWFLVIIASFFLGSGGGAIDASINIFAASKFSASVVNWLHAFYGIGATSGPFIVTWLLVQNKEWHYGYIAVGVVQLTLAFIFLLTVKYWKFSSENSETQYLGSFAEAFRLPFVWITILIFFIYTGLEIGVGQWIFTVLTKSRGINIEQAGLLTSAYWGSLTVGRIIFGFVLTRIKIHHVMITALTSVVIGTILLAISYNDLISSIGIVLIGFSNAPIFPCLISMTPKLVGERHSANIIGFQISAAMIGGALLPAFAGLLTKYFGLEIIPLAYVIEAILLLTLYIISSEKYKKLMV